MTIKIVSEVALVIWAFGCVFFGIIPAIPKKNYTVIGIWSLVGLAGVAGALYLAA